MSIFIGHKQIKGPAREISAFKEDARKPWKGHAWVSSGAKGLNFYIGLHQYFLNANREGSKWSKRSFIPIL